MGWIILLIILGILLFAAELIILPGITLAAVGSFCSLVAAVALGFAQDDITGWIVLAIVLIIISIMTAIFLKASTWKNVALHAKVTEALAKPIANVGQVGYAITRLAPMGKVMIESTVIEAKTMGEYIDENSPVEVIGHDNMNIIVKLSDHK